MLAMSLFHRWIYTAIVFIVLLIGILCSIYMKFYLFSAQTCPGCPREQLPSPANARSTTCRRMCTTKDCILTAAELVSSVDELHSDPCIDFHSYSCGNLPPQMPDDKDNIPMTVEQSLLIDFRNVINEISHNEIKPVRQLKMMYDDCVNFESSEEKAVPALLKVLSNIGLSGWPHLPEDWTFQTADGQMVSLDFVLSQLELLRSYNFLQITYEENQNRTRESPTGKTAVDVGIKLSRTSMTEEYRKPEIYEKELLAHKEMLQKIFGVLDVSEIQTEENVRDILLLEKTISLWLNQTDSLNSDIKPQNISDSEWKHYVHLLLHESGIALDSIDVQISSYTKSFRSMIEGHSDRQIANYLAYRFVKAKLEGLGFSLRGFFPNLVNMYDMAMIGVGLPKWKECVLKGAFFLEPILSYWYMLRRLDKNIRSDVQDLYYNVHHVAYSIIDEITWLNETSKSGIKQTIASLTSPVDKFATYANATYIENLYKDLEFLEETQFGNSMKFQMFSSRYNIRDKLMEGKKSLLAAKGFLAPNAMVSLDAEITIGLGLMRLPLFAADRAKVFNIAMFGSSLAHELVHVIQLHIDKTLFGINEDYGEPKAFKDYKNCVTKHYGNYKYQFIDHFLQSNMSFREDFADLVGTEISYRAYKEAIEQDGVTFGVQGLDATGDQLFFILFSQYYCQPMNEAIENMIFTTQNAHSPNKFRVLGTASNLRQFARAFKCSDKSPMHPKEKCTFIH